LLSEPATSGRAAGRSALWSIGPLRLSIDGWRPRLELSAARPSVGRAPAARRAGTPRLQRSGRSWPAPAWSPARHA